MRPDWFLTPQHHQLSGREGRFTPARPSGLHLTELILTVLRQTAAITGPLVLVPDTGDSPVVIGADTDLDAVLKEWDHTQPG
jgi:hypothetical protein